MYHHFLYIDPSSGSYLVQVIIAAVLGAAFYFKTIWLRIKMFFLKKKPLNDDGNNLSATDKTE